MCLVELLSQLTAACRLSRSVGRDSRDCRDMDVLTFQGFFTESKSDHFQENGKLFFLQQCVIFSLSYLFHLMHDVCLSIAKPIVIHMLEVLMQPGYCKRGHAITLHSKQCKVGVIWRICSQNRTNKKFLRMNCGLFLYILRLLKH